MSNKKPAVSTCIMITRVVVPIQYIAICDGCKNVNFQLINCDIFLMFAQNIDRGYKLEPPQ